MAGEVETGKAAVVLVHASASSGRQWQALADRLGPQFDVFAPDLHGYGGNADNHGTLPDDLALLKDLIGRQRGRVHLVGHSYGGLVSVRAALDLAPQIRSLTLIEPVCFHLLEEAGERDALAEIKGVRGRQTTATAAGDPEKAAKGFIDYWMGEGAWAGMPEGARKATAAAMPKVAAEWPGAMSATTRLADYAALPWPVLLIRAADTTLAARRVTDLISEQAAAARLVTVPDGGHMAPVTRRDAVNAILADFLRNPEFR